MIEWTQGHVETDGASLRYFRSGGPLPPLVLVHGLTDQALYFTRVAEPLARDWDVVAYDARGHGQSSRIAEVFDEATRVADLVAVITRLELDRPALIGHSMGGGTITVALADHPGLSRGAVLEDPNWWEPPPDQLERWLAGRREYFVDWQASLAELQRLPREAALELRRREEPGWTPVDLGTSLDGRLAVQPEALVHFGAEHRPWRPLIPQITCPTLVVIGDQPSAIVPRANVEEAAGLNPLVQWVEVAGAGHHIKYDCYAAFMAATETLLADLR